MSSGLNSDDSDGHVRELAVRSVAAAFLSIATVAVSLRCYVRGWLIKGFGWDDWAMVVAMVPTIDSNWHSLILESNTCRPFILCLARA